MKKQGMVLAIAVPLMWFGCNSCGEKNLSAEMVREGEQMIAEAATLSCTLHQLEDKTKVLWDQVVTSLDKNLPADMPEQERKNMLAVRNMDLIEMFEDYDQLDTTIHRLVREAGELDMKNAQDVLETKRKLEALEIKFGYFLQKIDKKNTTIREQWQAKFENAHHQSCK